MKTCKTCGTPKELDQFYVNKEMADGRLNICSECTKAYMHARRAQNPEYYRELDRIRHKKYYRSVRGKDCIVRARSKWHDQNPRKRAAQLLLTTAMRRNPTLKRGVCGKCGAANTQGHHENYDFPLVVVWLCPKHHKERHREMREQGIEP